MAKTDTAGREAFGISGRNYDIDGFALVEKSYSPNLHIPRHSHDSLMMSFVLEGTLIESNDHSQFECSPSGLAVNPAGEAHLCQFGPSGASCLVVEVMPQRLASLRQYSINPDQPVYAEKGMLSDLAGRIWREYKVMDQSSPLAIEGLMLELLAGLARRKTEKSSKLPAWLRQARDHLHDCCMEPIGLQQLAGFAGVHPSHLARLFRQHFGYTVGEYQRRLRLDRAIRELVASDKTLSEIAISTGYYDQSHFSQAFRRHTGMTPLAYQKLHRPRKSDHKSL